MAVESFVVFVRYTNLKLFPLCHGSEIFCDRAQFGLVNLRAEPQSSEICRNIVYRRLSICIGERWDTRMKYADSELGELKSIYGTESVIAVTVKFPVNTW